jgi:hypothetical protein
MGKSAGAEKMPKPRRGVRLVPRRRRVKRKSKESLVVQTEVKADGQATVERVAKLTWALAHGEGLRVRDAAAMTGLTVDNARRYLCKISRVIPIYDDPETHVWQVLAMQEAE